MMMDTQEQSQARGTDRESPSEDVGPPSGTPATNGRPCVLDEWFAAHDAYHKASETYNARLALVRAERDRGNWSMSVAEEYAALHSARSVALRSSEALYQYELIVRAILRDSRYMTPEEIRSSRSIIGGDAP